MQNFNLILRLYLLVKVKMRSASFKKVNVLFKNKNLIKHKKSFRIYSRLKEMITNAIPHLRLHFHWNKKYIYATKDIIRSKIKHG